MNQHQEMCLVEGEVKFSVRVATLVPVDKVEDEEYIKQLLEEIAEDEIDNSDTEVDFDNDVPVLVTRDTIARYLYQSVGNDAWRKIVQESRNEKAKSK